MANELLLGAVFWESDEDEKPQDALCTVQDGVVVHVTRADGFEARFLLHEMLALAEFVANEVERYDTEHEAEAVHGAEPF